MSLAVGLGGSVFYGRSYYVGVRYIDGIFF